MGDEAAIDALHDALGDVIDVTLRKGAACGIGRRELTTPIGSGVGSAIGCVVRLAPGDGPRRVM